MLTPKKMWFAEDVPKKIRKDCSTLFWYEPWLDRNMLNDHSNMLFDIAINKKKVYVKDMVSSRGVKGEEWICRGRLFA